jgi:uncharacterized protein YwqG
MDISQVQSLFTKAGFSRLLPHLDALVRPSVRLFATPTNESAVKVGSSKLGGSPDLPPGVSWPLYNGVPQSFVMQLRLEELASYPAASVLPQQGMLWFFYDAAQETYGDDPASKGGWCVLFRDHGLPDLVRTRAPDASSQKQFFAPCALRFSEELTMTAQPPLEVPDLAWSDDDQEKFDEVFEQFNTAASDPTPPHHRLLGFPDTIQDDMREQCQVVTQGLLDPDDPRYAAVAKGYRNWHLLLQVDSDERIGMKWSSSGMLYYWMTWADLQAHRFDTTWLVLQAE